MKKVTLFAAIIMLFATIGAFAQTDNDVISGKALVLQGMNVTHVTDLDFGWVSPGLSKTMGLTNNATGGQTGKGTETTGVFRVSASAGSNVSIQFTTLPANLVDGASNNLPIGSYTAGYGTAAPYDGGHGFTPGDVTQVYGGSFPSNTISSENAILVFIGGTVTPGASQAAGSYAANIQLTATYN